MKVSCSDPIELGAGPERVFLGGVDGLSLAGGVFDFQVDKLVVDVAVYFGDLLVRGLATHRVGR